MIRRLTYFPGKPNRTNTRKPVKPVQARAIITTRMARTKISLLLAQNTKIVRRTLTNKAIRQIQTRASIQARRRVASIYRQLTKKSRIPNRTSAKYTPIQKRPTQSIILAYGRIAEINKRVTPRARIPISALTLKPISQAQTRAPVQANNRISFITKVNWSLAIFTSERRRTLTIKSVYKPNTSSAILA